MALIIEDGSNVPDANSYVNLVDARTLLLSLGQNLDLDDEIAEQQILNSARYIDAFRARYQGSKTTSNQSMQWPRSGVVVDDDHIDFDTIPQDLIDAQVFAAYEYSQGNVLQPAVTGRSRQSAEVVRGVKVAYFNTGSVDGLLIYVRVNDSLNPLFDIFDTFALAGLRG